ncbi:hypothetical protein FA95DRAFT_1608691 [Auriscalpium vulgare]|uniref:Uncharacterized protein n=1 Tax=Auriscalpium vulgare TaxID=40419 RepID=A0ACB8RJD2_9AGAM|nr:hypothetical protein FA95DRAFT_1608691 [Auriscalpium vulgare]
MAFFSDPQDVLDVNILLTVHHYLLRPVKSGYSYINPYSHSTDTALPRRGIARTQTVFFHKNQDGDLDARADWGRPGAQPALEARQPSPPAGIKIRDFAFPPSDARHIGMSPLTARSSGPQHDAEASGTDAGNPLGIARKKRAREDDEEKSLVEAEPARSVRRCLPPRSPRKAA